MDKLTLLLSAKNPVYAVSNFSNSRYIIANFILEDSKSVRWSVTDSNTGTTINEYICMATLETIFEHYTFIEVTNPILATILGISLDEKV